MIYLIWLISAAVNIAVEAFSRNPKYFRFYDWLRPI